MTTYNTLRDQHTVVYSKLKKQSIQISIVRLLLAITFLSCGYLCIKSDDLLLLTPISISFIGYILLMRRHHKVTWEMQLSKTLIAINSNEIDFLERKKISYEDGIEYNNPNHFYSHDLDIFGSNSLFQNLNRTATYIGKTKLAELLLTLLPHDKIIQNQGAIKELTPKIEWRQSIYALSKLTKDSKKTYEKLLSWAHNNQNGPSTLIQFFSFCIPILLFAFITAYLVTSQGLYSSIAAFLFISNLGLLATQKKRIEKEIMDSGKIHEILKHYSFIIESIESEQFDNEHLLQIQQKLVSESIPASTKIKKLAQLFSDLDSIHNVFGLILFNGLFQYHTHTIKRLLNWKKEHATAIKNWLDCIGTIETLNSLSNFSYNNPDFTFPQLNKEHAIEMNNLGHPLLNKTSRIANTVDFNNQNFIILTGSNMSGKSTFLRTLGINMVLTGIGSPICATTANIHPMPILVSMRLADSLNDSESYFFAEVKRLKQIMTELKNQTSFVLLDEILRGTNSDDKRSGTVNVIKKIIAKNTFGAIATHDLEVCLTTNEFPQTLINKCFEVEIINNELAFDYKLRDGICKNKSATFLMQKMEII